MELIRRGVLAAGLVALALWLSMPTAWAKNAAVIDAEVDAALVELTETTPGAETLLDRAEGVLVMPKITKAGFIVGGEYGEGALRVDGTTAAYYSVAGGSLGFQAGVQTVSQAILFMTEEALQKFRSARGWEAGADAEVTLIKTGANIGANTTKTNQPVIAIVFGQNGLLAGASIDGAKYTRIER
jgi:lipid-binding SYLF domain-containing protein